MPIKATNNFVFLIRDQVKTEQSGFTIPGAGHEKPHVGTIFSVGGLVKDPEIKRGKNQKALFHKGIGFDIQFEDVTYLVLQEHEIIAIIL